MHDSLVHRFFLPLHEWAMHRPTLLLARQLEASQWLAANKFRALQDRKLRRLIAHAYRHCPYWRELFDGRGLQPRDIRGVEDLPKLPLLTRRTIRQRAEEMRWSHAPTKVLSYRTSGTTDDNLDFFWHRRRQAWDKACRIRAHRWFGIQPSMRELYLWPVDHPMTVKGRMQDRLRRMRDWLSNDLLIDVAGDEWNDPEQTARRWRAFDPHVVFGYPSRLVQIVREALTGANPSLRQVFVTGECLFDAQRQALQDTLGVPVAAEYGVQEAGFIAHQCPEGHYHVSGEAVFAEIIHNGKAAEPGQYGEIVLTNFASAMMPIIRYRTGDVVQHHPTSCPCGRSLPVIGPIAGRTTEFLPKRDGSMLTPAEAVRRFAPFIREDRFRITVRPDHSVHVAVVSGALDRLDQIDRLRNVLADLLGTETQITVSSVPALDVPRSCKHRPVVNESAQWEG